VVSGKDKDQDLITIARISKPQGRIGEVAAELMTDFPERFDDLEKVIVAFPNGEQQTLSLTGSWPHKGRVILKFEGVDSISDAEKLKGCKILISPDDLVELPEDSFFDFELEGCEVVDSSNRSIGTVREVVRTGGTDLLAVVTESGDEKLIPFADSICTNVDVEGKRIVIDPPEGLLEL